MVPWLNQDFRFGKEVVTSYPSTNSLSSQGTQLVNDISSAGGLGYILIGHSQGGLISRYAAQYFQTQNPNASPVKGVVTMDTPNQGADIAATGGPTILVGFEFFAQYLWGVTGCSTPDDNGVCFLAWTALNAAPPLADGFYSSLPDMQDMLPGSTFLTTVNGYKEDFVQAGIIGNTPQRWNEARILWDTISPFIYPPIICEPDEPESPCGERAFALIVEETYDTVETALLATIIEQIFDPCDDLSAQIEYYTEILIGMDAIDAFWNLIVSGGSASDAIVQSSSQNYPSATAVQYPINGADSHLRSTRSPYDRTALDQVLGGPQFNVPTQASCAFSASPSSYSISAGAGTAALELNTGAGCQWSAVSNAPWITITSGATGISSENIEFSVAANPVTVPRTGAIQAGNGSATISFPVTQAGVCLYSLSASNIAIQPGGGSFTVTVVTNTGCVWSVVSNSSWLTVTSGASGTGSGSFTLTAAPNSNDTDLVGTITVMNQTLTVTLGDPAGAPSTGSVTLNGGPLSTIYNPCYTPSWPYVSCPYTFYDDGFIAVTVGGQTFTQWYEGGTFTTAQVATGLASQMNSPDSLVSATASGSTITIRSAINGAATNYALSTSYGYNTEFFSWPAVTATVSGPNLTGGSN